MMKGEALWKAELGVDQFPWELTGYRLRLIANSEPDMGSLSDTDMEHLARGLEKSRGMNFTERTDATHGSDWQNAELGNMRYEDMIDESPEKESIIRFLEASSKYMRL